MAEESSRRTSRRTRRIEEKLKRDARICKCDLSHCQGTVKGTEGECPSAEKKSERRRDKEIRRCRDMAGRAVNYKRSAKPPWFSSSGTGVSRRIDNTGLACAAG